MKKRAVVTDLNKHIKESPDMQKLLHKRRKTHRIIFILIAIIAVALCIGTIVFLCNRTVQIYSITVSGNEIIDSDVVVSDIQHSLTGKYLYLIPKTNIFFYPKNEIYESLKKNFPRFNSINISLVDKTTLAVSVTEERGTALWCGGDSEIPDMTAQCYFTDTNGKIIDVAPYYSGNVYLRFFGGDIASSTSNPLGESFVDDDAFQHLIDFSKHIMSLGFQIKAVRITPIGEDYFILDLGNTNTAYVQFKSDDNFNTLFSNLQTALSNATLATQISSSKTNLQYFDLRFKNKVYYKFNDTVTASTSKQ